MDLADIDGKTPLIFREIWVFPNLNGIFPFIFFNKVKSKFSYNRAYLKKNSHMLLEYGC